MASCRATNGKLVGIVLTFPVSISIGGVLIPSMQQLIAYHPKYHGRRLWYILIRELERRVNLANINHLVLTRDSADLMKSVSTAHIWTYTFGHPANIQLPSSPRTPGWRRMTSEDVPIVH